MLTFRPLQWQDAAPLYVWRHDKETVRQSINPPPLWQEHLFWMNEAVGRKRIWIGSIAPDGPPVVCVSLDGEKINIMTNPLYREFGFATEAIKYVQTFGLRLVAIIKQGNEASMRLFQKCDFSCIKDTNKIETWEWLP